MNDIIGPDGKAEHPLKMRAKSFAKGTRIVTRTGGGGGFGDPLARPVDEVLDDVQAGLVSIEHAWSDYGVRVSPDLSVDAAASKPRTVLR